MASDTWDDGDSARLSDLTRDGALAPIADAIVRPVELERDSYREVAVQKTVELQAFKAALGDVEAEADRRIRRPHLRSVEEA